MGDRVITPITTGENKGKFHLRIGWGDNRETHQGSRKELLKILKDYKAQPKDPNRGFRYGDKVKHDVRKITAKGHPHYGEWTWREYENQERVQKFSKDKPAGETRISPVEERKAKVKEARKKGKIFDPSTGRERKAISPWLGLRGTGFKPLSVEEEKIFNLLKDGELTGADQRSVDRFKGKSWGELSNKGRGLFKRSWREWRDNYNKVKGKLSKTQLREVVSKALGENIPLSTLQGQGPKGLYTTPLGKEVKSLLKPTKIGPGGRNAPVFYENPDAEKLKKLKIAFLKNPTQGKMNKLRSITVDNILGVHEKFGSTLRAGNIPDIAKVIEKVPGINSSKQAAYATIRLAQIYGGHNFNFSPEVAANSIKKLEDIRLNQVASTKMFKVINASPWMDPYKHEFYKYNLSLIDEKLGREVGTFAGFKRKAVQILKDN